LRNQSGMTKDEYERQAKKLIGIYNGHQTTECSTMIARARTAKQFERFKEEAKDFPNIEWIASRSANARDLHQSFSGIIRPIDDAFWNDNSPGNLYNCKCSWKTTDKQTTDAPTETARPHDGLDGNPANTGELFTDKHPYFNPDKDGSDLAVTELPKKNDAGLNWLDKKAMLEAPDEVAFEWNKDGFWEHILAKTEDEISENREMAKILLNNGYKDVKLMPQINAKEPSLRERYFGKPYISTHSTKNGDSIVDGKIIEFKYLRGGESMHKEMKEAAKQADIIFIKSKDYLSKDDINDFLNKQWKSASPNRANIKEILLLNTDGEFYVFSRGQLL